MTEQAKSDNNQMRAEAAYQNHMNANNNPDNETGQQSSYDDAGTSTYRD